MPEIIKRKYEGQERWTRDLHDIARITDKPSVGKETKIADKEVRFNLYMLLDLLRRRECGTERDGLRARRYDGGPAGGAGSDLTQTEAAALFGLPGDDEDDDRKDDWSGHVQFDPMAGLIDEALSAMSEAARNLRVFEKKLGLILNAGAVLQGPERPAGKCVVCDRPVTRTDQDIWHRGRYCTACNSAWKRDGRPHDLEEDRWAVARRTELEDAGRLYSQVTTAGDRRTGYEVDEIDALVASGVLPDQRKSA